ncbi:hypothetical protein C942_02768 [Photobacterium marinum]|uniref:Uncharacterized protein n=1 Tax=Photobacterium marinum TaxID=1056511 RepID=L8JIG9_9GAMM|nr:ABC transporter substrate binding protein [Photobacterium marinum]ELR67259.1 hypothetical protein C942_02768 [Photobacterium marinum]
MINRYLMSLIICCLLASGAAMANWPQWLGEEINTHHQADWKIEPAGNSVTFIPRGEQPKVWVLISRKAHSYDTALSTMLTVFRRELSSATFRVFLLPDNPATLKRWIQVAEENANLIYTVGSKATVAMHKVYAGGKLPVVSVNAKDPVLLGLTNSYETSGDNFAFTSLNLPADITFSFLRRFKPELTQIGILYAKSNTSAYLTQYLPLKEEAEQHGVQVFPIEVDEGVRGGSLQAVMKHQVAAMKATDPELENSLLWLTGSSSLLDRVDDIYTFSDKLPMLTVVPDAVNGSENSALMSVGVSFENNAHQAALYGIRILRDGEEPASLPVGLLSPPDISISFKQAERINVQIPFVLIEMASDIYAHNGGMIRAAGMSMETSDL